MPRKPKPLDDLPEDYRQTLHLSCDKQSLIQLDRLVERMRRDPILGRQKNLGREKAALYAIAESAENGPERITRERR